ncbi:hypothetical protein QAD02_008667 [Eretmocerus hayati]|uniref:Uncharacterized protein n=1 Tax=Eretmocerus hayati TaxID=131215 RepID=A0ACC2NBM2_9HYME|nr:hypothetical protein QAD02_008667 [Eretmocerus hayati]
MQHLISRKILNSLNPRLQQFSSIRYDSTRLANTAAAIGREEHVKLDNENVIDTPLRQSHQRITAEPAAAVVTKNVAALTNFDALNAASASSATDAVQTNTSVDIPVTSRVREDLEFEEIPGPAALKLLEKYWRYVPLLGTQLLRSAFINGLTEGNLVWGRNIAPLNYLFNEYGPVVRINGPLTGDVVLIHRPEHVAKVFEEEGDTPARSSIDVLQHYRQHHRKYRFTGPFCTEGSQNTEWMQIKKSLESPIVEQLKNQFGNLEMASEELALRIRQIRNRQDEVPPSFSHELSRWGMECFWALILNKKMGFLDSTSYAETSEATRFIEALNDAHVNMSRCETGFQMWRFFETPFSSKLFNACDLIDGIIGKYIRTAMSNLKGNVSPGEGDSSACSSIMENLLVKRRMSPEDVSTLMMDMIILGVQATANSQAFLLYYLAKNPRVQKNLYDEVASKINNSDQLNIKKFYDMPYLTACIKECLRLRPAFPYITRNLPRDITLHGYKIPKNTYLIMANQISSLREENFEDPHKFRPERWLRNDNNSYPKCSYLPFGKGLRSCMGENMAKLQMMLLTSRIIREFRVEYDYADIGSRFLMMNVPNKPLRFRFVERD